MWKTPGQVSFLNYKNKQQTLCNTAEETGKNMLTRRALTGLKKMVLKHHPKGK
jgi:hypothetical protein